MESGSGRLSSLRSAKTKRRRTASPSPTRRSERLSDGKQQTKSALKELSIAGVKQKNKRRSSMRRSLVATLESIRTQDATATRQEESKVNGIDEGEKVPDSVKITQPENNGPGPSTDCRSSLVFSVPPSASQNVVSNFESKNISKLQAEAVAWTEQLEKYKRLQEVPVDFGLSTNFNLEEIDSKYQFWNEQVSDLEDKLASAFTVINKTMQRIDQIKTLQRTRLSKEMEETYNIVLKDRGGEDPKILIKKIFALNNSLTDR